MLSVSLPSYNKSPRVIQSLANSIELTSVIYRISQRFGCVSLEKYCLINEVDKVREKKTQHIPSDCGNGPKGFCTPYLTCQTLISVAAWCEVRPYLIRRHFQVISLHPFPHYHFTRQRRSSSAWWQLLLPSKSLWRQRNVSLLMKEFLALVVTRQTPVLIYLPPTPLLYHPLFSTYLS